MPPTSPSLDDLDLLDIRALVVAGLAAHARRAWLARAAAAPIPPPPAPRGRHVSVAELDTAVAAGLVRGHSSLQEARTMAKVHVKLVPEPAREGRRAPCVVCGLSLPPAVAGVPICGPCADAPEQTRARLDTRRAAHTRALAAADVELDAALDALDAADRERWAKIGAWRLAVARGARWAADTTDPVAVQVLAERPTPADAQARLDKVKDAILLDPAQAVAALDEDDARRWAKIVENRAVAEAGGGWAVAWLAKVEAAVEDASSPKVSDALRRAWRAADVSDPLRRAWLADEVAFWARASALEELRRVDVAAAHLEAALEALGPSVTVRVASVSTPGTVHEVARDGSACTCPGFRRHGHCHHADARRGEQAA